ncbi:MAG TPA: glycosyltransferase family 2 protein [Aequorivita sp.]|nr:glycosyltransferase family 2 protein [Aequorivita sp.]
MKVAVVILNWNGIELLKKFLPSVVAHSKEATVYLADNASEDDSINFVLNHFPSVKIIKNEINGGYAKGYNDALQNLSEDIFVLLNSDVEVTENWLQPILTEFEKDSSMVAAQPKILDFKNPSHFEYAGAGGGYIDKYGYPYCRGRIFDILEEDFGQYDDIVQIFWASGACLFVRSTAFWDAGGLDKDYFAHQEEIDLCWRLQAKGGKIRYVGTSKVFHLGGATLDASSPQKTFYNFRNSMLNLLKNVGGAKAFWFIFIRMILDGVAAFKFLFQGKPKHFLAVLKAHISFYKLLTKFLQKRKTHASYFKYFRIKSIVFQHFMLKKQFFSQL